MNVNQTYCGDHFAIYTNIKSLYCTPETNVMLYVKLFLNKSKEESEKGKKGEKEKERVWRKVYCKSMDRFFSQTNKGC